TGLPLLSAILLKFSSGEGLAVRKILQNRSRLLSRGRDQTSAFKRTAGACHAFGKEELDILFDARNRTDMLALHVEEQRARHGIFTGGDGLQRRRYTGNGGNLERVAVLVVEAQAEDANGVRIALKTSKRFGVVAGDFHHNVLTDGEAGFFGSVSRKLCSFTTGGKN